MHAGLVGTGFEVAWGGAAVAAGADLGFEDEALALPCAEFLFGEIDFGALGCGGDAERAAFPLEDGGGVARVGGGEELGGSGGDEGGGGDEERAVGELAGGVGGDGGGVEDEAFGGGVPCGRPREEPGDLVEGDEERVRDGVEGDAIGGGDSGGERQSPGEEEAAAKQAEQNRHVGRKVRVGVSAKAKPDGDEGGEDGVALTKTRLSGFGSASWSRLTTAQ